MKGDKYVFHHGFLVFFLFLFTAQNSAVFGIRFIRKKSSSV